jgi:hypothetical protein
MRSDPDGSGCRSTAGKVTPFVRTVIVGSMNTITALTPQSLNSVSYLFSSWSDGGNATRSSRRVATGVLSTFAAS